LVQSKRKSLWEKLESTNLCTRNQSFNISHFYSNWKNVLLIVFRIELSTRRKNK
jgi:hypothetical protein